MTEIKTATNVDLRKLYDDSAFTIIGLCDEQKEYEALENYLFNTCNLTRPENVVIYKCSGGLVNEEFGIPMMNRFKDDLNIVFMPLSNFENGEIGRLAMIKLSIGARWFDDVINNSLPDVYEEED